MPSPPWRDSHYPGKAHLLRHAAEQGQLIFVKCTRCRRRAVYLASDLVTMLNPEQDALTPPFPCSHCGSDRHVWVDCRVCSSDEVGNLLIRRPATVRRTIWRTVKLGDP